MSGVYLLDTNIISELMRDAGGAAAGRFRQHLTGSGEVQVVTSIVVQCELRYGLRKASSPRLLQAYALQMAQLPVLPLDGLVVEHYANLRNSLASVGKPIGPLDTLIAAHALALDATLVSADAEFARIPGLALENWLI
jgi:tRNA(fMet)-specific endonuclease VapC